MVSPGLNFERHGLGLLNCLTDDKGQPTLAGQRGLLRLPPAHTAVYGPHKEREIPPRAGPSPPRLKGVVHEECAGRLQDGTTRYIRRMKTPLAPPDQVELILC